MLRYWDGEAGEARALGLLAASSVLPIPILGGGHLAMGAILFFCNKRFPFSFLPWRMGVESHCARVSFHQKVPMDTVI